MLTIQFKFYDDEMDRAGLQLSGHLGSISLEILHAHSDPFYNECRAYGKLIEKNLNGKVAVQCHGHITLPAKMEDELERRFGVGDWDRPEAEYNKPASKRQVLRAVVKELVQKDVPFTEKTLARMLRDLYCIRRQGIYPSDIFARNYKGGLLLDLSIAKTEPHFLLEIEDDWRVKTYKNRDLWQFDDMVEESEVKAWVRALPNEEYIAKLRPRPKEKS